MPRTPSIINFQIRKFFDVSLARGPTQDFFDEYVYWARGVGVEFVGGSVG